MEDAQGLAKAANTLADKWSLLPEFMRVGCRGAAPFAVVPGAARRTVTSRLLEHAARRRTQSRGLVRQQIASFNYFVNTELKKIVEANSEVRSEVRGVAPQPRPALNDRTRSPLRAGARARAHRLPRVFGQVDPTFFLKYEDIRVGKPVFEEESFIENDRSASPRAPGARTHRLDAAPLRAMKRAAAHAPCPHPPSAPRRHLRPAAAQSPRWNAVRVASRTPRPSSWM